LLVAGTESAEFLQKLQDEAQAQKMQPPMASRVNSIIQMLASAAGLLIFCNDAVFLCFTCIIFNGK